MIDIKTEHRAFIYLMVTVTAWGSFHVVGKFVLSVIPPFATVTLRYAIALAALTIALRLKMRGRPLPKIAPEDRKYVFLIGFLGYFISVGAQMIGMRLSVPSTSSLLNSLNPIFTIVFSFFILKERMTWNRLVSVLSALTGAIVITAGVISPEIRLGVAVILFAVMLWSFMSVLVRHVTKKYDSLLITTYGILIGAALTLPVAIGEQVMNPLTLTIDLKLVAAVLYIGLIGTALPLYLWNLSLSMIDACHCALFYPVQPVVSMLLSWLFMGEQITPRFLIGTALVAFGVLYTVTSANNPARLRADVKSRD